MTSENLPATQYPTIENYLALCSDSGKVAQIINDNMGGQTLTPFDLDRAKVPTGGATSWEVPDLDEGTKSVKSIEGIIIHYTSPRGYWAAGLDQGGASTPPDCFSPDGKIGIGAPGGDCRTCPFNEFGSAEKGNGKACKEKRMLFLLQPESYLPMVVQVPTMSLKPINQYFMRLAARGTPFYGVVTALSLEKAQQTGGGLPFSKIAPSMASRLTPEELAKVEETRNTLLPHLVEVATVGIIPDEEDVEAAA